MRATRRRDTAAEIDVRKHLTRDGLRYRVDVPPLPGTRWRADIVFTRARVAVFVDGCFWHGCPDHGTWPAAHASWWRTKILRNRERDLHSTQVLVDAGWQVMRFWEHDSAEEVAGMIAKAVRGIPRD
jgi:DNA mismatch endonuclease, patch repair protein